MFWKRKDNEQKNEPKGAKLPGPREIPEIVKKQIPATTIDPDMLPFLKALTKNSEAGEKVFDFRIFDPSEAEARTLKVVNYNSLDGIDEMVICDGSYDEATKKAVVNAKRSMPKYKLLTPDEILKQIENLKDVGEKVFFYAAAGTGSGGPLGRGAVVIKVNPTNSEKKRKKYGIYGTSVINMQPDAGKEALIFDSDKTKEIAKWVSEAHKPRFC